MTDLKATHASNQIHSRKSASDFIFNKCSKFVATITLLISLHLIKSGFLKFLHNSYLVAFHPESGISRNKFSETL